MLTQPQALVARAASVLVARGARADAAEIQAQHLVEGELRGHPSHGVRRLAVLAERIDAGLLDPRAEPEMTWTATGALRVDGARGFGPPAAFRAIDALVERLPEAGVAVASLRRTHHLGMLSPYVERIASVGAVGLVLSSTEGLVHPWGGAGALLGTNPLGIGIAARERPLVLDMSTGAVSAGKILDHRAKGLPIPDGWAVDADGVPTTDAAAAASGAISPFGGAKGYALGIALGAMVAALTDTALGGDVHGTLDAEHEVTKGDVIIAIDASALAGANARGRLAEYFDGVRSSGPDVTVPGDRARRSRAEGLRNGIRVSPDVLATLDDLEKEVR